jgi:hypothetical protein
VIVGHNPPVSGVGAFGSQDLGFRTSIFGSQDLGFKTSIFGSQDLSFRTLLACVSSPPRPTSPKCNRGRFCHRIVVSDIQTHRLPFLFSPLSSSSSLACSSAALLLQATLRPCWEPENDRARTARAENQRTVVLVLPMRGTREPAGLL